VTRRPVEIIAEMAMPDEEIVSYRTLRRVVGLLGVALPVVVAAWGCYLQHRLEILPSISDYYALRTRDALVGILFTIAWFLFTYHGYDRRDNIAGNAACVFALGVALFPNAGPTASPAIHFTSAAGRFLVLAYFSLFLFTKTGGTPTPQKLIRNRIYRGCGIIIVASILLLALLHVAGRDLPVRRVAPVFVLETLALWAFGVSWFVKGETVFKDRLSLPS
jgi:hypothetical protein